MTVSKWFQPTTVVSRSKILRKAARDRDRGAPVPVIRGVKLVDLDAWPYPRAGVSVTYIDRDEIFYTTRDLQKIFDIDKATVYKWQKVGLIPKPFFTKTNQYKKETKYYIRPQLAVTAKVVNDLRRQGVLRFTKAKIGHHIAMVKEGNKIAIEEWNKRRDAKRLKKVRKSQAVRWLDND